MPKLNLGSGGLCYEDFINIDKKPLPLVSLLADIRHLPLKDKCAELILVHHCWEHIPRQETYNTLKEWYRVLQDGGILDLESPDFDENCRDYVKALDDGDFDKQTINKAFIYGGDSPASEDTHRWGYSPGLMRVYLRDVGFTNIDKLKPMTYHRNQAACFRVRAIK